LTIVTNGTIHNAVNEWFSNQASAEATYGLITAWNTAAVTSLEYLFCGYDDAAFCGAAHTLGATPWDVG
jgi:hypothetical protein